VLVEGGQKMDGATLGQGAVHGGQVGEKPVLAGANIGDAERCWIPISARRATAWRCSGQATRTATAEERRRGTAGWMP
jgi:hypothetical protein